MRAGSVNIIAFVALISLLGGITVVGITHEDDDRPYIYTTMSWQQEMVQEIVGDTYTVKSFLPPNSDPHSTDLTPGSLPSGNTVAYFAIGSHVEWEERNLSVIKDELNILTFECCEELIERGDMEHLLPGHCHHGGHDHSDHDHHDSADPHVWTSPERLGQIAEYITEKLIELDPENEAIFREGCDSYTAKTDELAVYAEILENKADATIIVWHPSWAYLLPANVTEEPMLETAQTQTTPSQMLQLVMGTAEDPIKVFLSNEREIKGMTEAELGGSGVYVKIIVINVLASDWLDELYKAITVFGEELEAA
mgnify:CR=1 FL=1|jgi:ABC-type Zn uptake system ZnuABC Zn-binding protein ZnuA